MKDTLKLIRRFILILMVFILLLLMLNILLFIAVSYRQASSGSPWAAAQSVADSLAESPDGTYVLSEDGAKLLERNGAWAVLIPDTGGDAVWHSGSLPEDIPLHFTAADIAMAVRGYIADYPMTTGARGGQLLMMGFPKDAYWKLMWNTFDYSLIAGLPRTGAIFLLCNLIAVTIIYMAATSGVLRSVRPILLGIESLPKERNVFVREQGLLSGLARSINRAAEQLRTQEYELKKKETARANWIAGVSHDIRTPLSMVMGYSGQLEADPQLKEPQRQKAAVIRRQSEKMRNLISDLNLTSKLEYNMQPMHMEPLNLTAVVRQVAVDFINNDIEGKYPIQWTADDTMNTCMVTGDRQLLLRAVTNIIQNCVNHNGNGCHIFIEITGPVAEPAADGASALRPDSLPSASPPLHRDSHLASAAHGSRQFWRVCIADDGSGVSDAQLAALDHAPHYMMCDAQISQQRHGLGLQIVRQIVQVHGGSVTLSRAPDGGFAVTMDIPVAKH